MFTGLKAFFAARRLGLRDRGEVQTEYHWDGKRSELVKMYTSHVFCNSHVRVGIVRATGELVRWCCVCEATWSPNVGDDNGGTGRRVIPQPLTLVKNSSRK